MLSIVKTIIKRISKFSIEGFLLQTCLNIMAASFRCWIISLIKSMLIRCAKFRMPAKTSLRNFEFTFQTRTLKQMQNSYCRMLLLFFTISLLLMMAYPYANYLFIYYFTFIFICIFYFFFCLFYCNLSPPPSFCFYFYCFLSNASCLYILFLIFFCLKVIASLSFSKYRLSINVEFNTFIKSSGNSLSYFRLIN